MGTVFSAGTLFWKKEAPLSEILAFLKDTYCRTIGVEYMYMSDMAQKRWLQERLESVRATPSYSPEYRKHILERLTAAETL
jgi:2-oxoglutarate dehydrogenase E1 component